MDPLSIANLTISVLDQLWRLGETTAELVANYRDFDEASPTQTDSRVLESKVKDENNRTRALQMLLFEPSTTYGGKSLFEQFDADVQDQIHILLEEAVLVLDQAYQLLYRRQQAAADDKNAKISEQLSGPIQSNKIFSSFRLMLKPPRTSSPTSPTSNEESSKYLRPLQRLRWSLLDKKRLESIIREFGELNSRVHESIKLLCLGTSIGVDLQHLRRLENDHNSQILGFNIDAKLQMTASQVQEMSQSLEIQDVNLHQQLEDVKRVEDRFGILDWGGKPMLVEYRPYQEGSPVSVEMSSRTRHLVDNLAHLLHQPKEIVFRTPCCTGWVSQTRHNRVAFVFAIPDAVEPAPVSLLGLLSSEAPPPTLGQKFWLAAKLSRCISQLQLVKWVHESFRSENIVFFPKHEKSTTLVPRIDLSEPWVLGFEFSRPEQYFSAGLEDKCLARDVYRHPDRQQSPTQPFIKLHDIYALGVVLLEIGLWQPALTLEKSGFARVKPNAITKVLIRHAEKRLGAKMGEKYQAVVLTCLRSDFQCYNDTKEDIKLQQAFRAQVVDVLEKIALCM
ncbi:hypothetical protein THARTR1_07614 [Trichoderma harzianum]|uniref:DUF7580 domain-containing protein n=1 Tax=Trichoderma harzianum TaxID=5544 RepID=A0A2K0U243_TRIHA|nr:hypothetical protein THARTR1_07614 [Trichoderma harzianum]